MSTGRPSRPRRLARAPPRPRAHRPRPPRRSGCRWRAACAACEAEPLGQRDEVVVAHPARRARARRCRAAPPRCRLTAPLPFEDASRRGRSPWPSAIRLPAWPSSRLRRTGRGPPRRRPGGSPSARSSRPAPPPSPEHPPAAGTRERRLDQPRAEPGPRRSARTTSEPSSTASGPAGRSWRSRPPPRRPRRRRSSASRSRTGSPARRASTCAPPLHPPRPPADQRRGGPFVGRRTHGGPSCPVATVLGGAERRWQRRTFRLPRRRAPGNAARHADLATR